MPLFHEPKTVYYVSHYEKGIKCLNLTKQLNFGKLCVSSFVWLRYLRAEFIKVLIEGKISSPHFRSSPPSGLGLPICSPPHVPRCLSVPYPLAAHLLPSPRHPAAYWTDACPLEIIQLDFQYNRVTKCKLTPLPGPSATHKHSTETGGQSL